MPRRRQIGTTSTHRSGRKRERRSTHDEDESSGEDRSRSRSPRRPMNAYQAFIQSSLKNTRLNGVTLGERVKALALQWNGQTNDEKNVYAGRAAQVNLNDNRTRKPKGRLTAFNVFTKDELTGQHLRGEAFSIRMKEVGERWKSLPADQKVGFQTRADLANIGRHRVARRGR